MAEKMLVTQALDERDLLKKRISDAINKANLVSVKRPNDTKTESGVNVEEFEKDAKSMLQKIKDLIDRYERLDTAILLSNVNETVEVAGKEITRASAINLRKNLINTVRPSVTDFRGMLISKLSSEIGSAKLQIQKSQSIADKQREIMVHNTSSSEGKSITQEAMQGIEAYCESIIGVLVDPIKAEDSLADLVAERDALISNLESAIKISNATTYVEF